MKILIDTNVLIAAIITPGVCFEALEYCLKDHEVFASQFIVTEFKRILKRKLGYTDNEVNDATRLIFKKINMVEPVPACTAVIKDHDDLHVLGAAVAAACDLIVTGDKELLGLKRYQGIAIIPPGDLWKYTTEKR